MEPTAVTSTTAAAQPQTTSTATTEAVTTDFDTFLALLTAQLENQDPLKPVESTEFVAQLASFSAVEQQVATNTKLDQLVAAFSQGAEGLSNWIGLETEAATLLRFDGAPVELRTEPLAEAQNAVLVVRNEAGDVVARQPVDPAASDISWSGEIAGGTAPAGLYSFSVERSDGRDALPTDQARGFSRITEARLENGQTVLVLEGGKTFPASEVGTLRATR